MRLVDWIMAGEIIGSLLILAVITCVSRRPRNYYGKDADKLAVRQRNGYVCGAVVFAFIHYWYILTSILSTLIVLYIGVFEETGTTDIKARIVLYSVLSLFTTICPFVVNLLKISKKKREAFRIIEGELLKETKFGEALMRCESIIAEGFDD